jgi:hypothetical protein
MQKKLYRTVNGLLEKIDHSAGDEQALVGILHALVESPDMSGYGVVSGRLYRERERDYMLIESIGEHGAAIAGKTVDRDYQVVQDIERRRVWVISPETPGWDADVEQQFSDTDSAAVLVGRDPAYILSLGIRHHGSEDDLLVLLGTIRAAVDLKLREQALASQMRQAKAIQQSLLPARLPEVPGFDLAAVSIPADEVGGDVYDLQWVEEGVLGIMLADASGHGLPAALQARDVVIGLRMGQAENHKITATVSQLNNVIHRSGLASRFISLFYGELEESGNFAYVNGGHCPPLLLTPAGEVFELKTCGPVLGPVADAVYRRGYLTMRPGEVLLMFTDGITERLQAGSESEEFGREGLIAVVRDAMDRDAQGIAETIVDTVRRFGGAKPFGDDVSVVVLKRLPADDHPPAEDLTQLAVETRR